MPITRGEPPGDLPARCYMKGIRPMDSKETVYLRLVEKRKLFQFENLMNPSEIEEGRFDCDHVEMWAQWMGNLNAKIMLVGKDFGGKDFFLRFQGGCDPNSTTNRNLIRLFAALGIDIGNPDRPNHSAPVFFTNSILGIIDSSAKGGNIISLRTQKESALEFLRHLIEIVDPKIIVAMGKEAYKGICLALGQEGHRTLRQALDNNPMKSTDGRLVFAVFHCGGLGLANRSLELQESDWRNIKLYL